MQKCGLLPPRARSNEFTFPQTFQELLDIPNLDVALFAGTFFHREYKQLCVGVFFTESLQAFSVIRSDILG